MADLEAQLREGVEHLVAQEHPGLGAAGPNPLIAQAREDEFMIEDHEENQLQDSVCESGNEYQKVFVHVNDLADVLKRLEKIEEEKCMWKEKCHEYRDRISTLLQEVARDSPNISSHVQAEMSHLREENEQLRAKVKTLSAENCRLTRTVKDLASSCSAAEALLETAKKEVLDWEKEADYWKREYEVVWQSIIPINHCVRQHAVC